MKLVHWVLLLGIVWLIQAGNQSHLGTENDRLQRENQVLKKLLAERSADPREDAPVSPAVHERSPESKWGAWMKVWSIWWSKRSDSHGKDFITSRGRPCG